MSQTVEKDTDVEVLPEGEDFPFLVIINDNKNESIWTKCTEWLLQNVGEYEVKWKVLTTKGAKAKSVEIDQDRIYLTFAEEADSAFFTMTWG